MFGRLLQLSLGAKAKSSNALISRASFGSRENRSSSAESFELDGSCDGQLRDGQLRDLYRSRGKAHRLAVTLGMARKKSRQAAAENCDVAQDMKLRVVSVGFSCWSRGRRSAANRAQQLACTRFCFLSFGWLVLLVFLPLARLEPYSF